MKEKQCFFDTNIIIYLYSIDEISKKTRIEAILNKEKTIVISTQVINEVSNVMLKKKKMPVEKILKVINELVEIFDVKIINTLIIKLALSICSKYKYSYYDSLMLAAAIENNCQILYTEDMQNKQIIENSLKIINPFV